jgi:hypothetical protein
MQSVRKIRKISGKLWIKVKMIIKKGNVTELKDEFLDEIFDK